MTPIIEFKNYTFKYRAQAEPTLLDINLKIYPGEKVLIVGPSGSGKKRDNRLESDDKRGRKSVK